MKAVGVLGNFTDVNAIVHAAAKVNEAGYKDWDCFTPYPVHGLDKAMGVKRTFLPYISFMGGVVGLIAAISLQMWTGAIDYKLNIGGKPLFALQFSIPIDFELTVLVCAISTVAGLFHFCKLPTWWNPFQNDKGFAKATDDEYVIGIYANDDRYHEANVMALLQSVGANDVRVVHEGDEHL